MSEPVTPTEPQPFSPTSEPVTPSGGCGRMAAIGCATLAVLVVIGLAVFLFKADDLLRWSMGMMKDQVVSLAPDDFTDDERQRLEAAFDAALDAMEAGRTSPADVQRLQASTLRLAGKGPGEVTREDLLELTVLLEALAEGAATEGDEPAPAPAPAEAVP